MHLGDKHKVMIEFRSLKLISASPAKLILLCSQILMPQEKYIHILALFNKLVEPHDMFLLQVYHQI